MVGFDTLKPSIALLVFRQLIIWVSASSLNVVFFFGLWDILAGLQPISSNHRCRKSIFVN